MKRYLITFILLINLPALLHAQAIDPDKAGSTPSIQEMNKQVAKLRAQGKTAKEIYDYQQTLLVPVVGGSISGNVFKNDGVSPLSFDANITAYDEYGFYKSSAYISAGNSVYTIFSLPPGLYYVQVSPYGNYIGEFYNDATDWRKATLVTVDLDSQVTGIDFQIEEGKVISGKILEEISLDPLAGYFTQFMLFNADAKLESDINRYYYISPDQTGRYFLQGLAPGDYKLKVLVDRYQQEFYQDKAKLSDADVLSLTAQTDTLKFINFLLAPVVGVQDGYEPNNTYQTAYQMMIGDSVTPQINPAGDLDFFTLNGTAGDSLIILLKAGSIGSDMLPYMIVYDSTGTNWLGSWSGSDLKITNILLPYTGRYYCLITNNSPQSGGEEYYYTFIINRAPTLMTGSISGNVFLDNPQTPYNHQGYYIYLYEKETMNMIRSFYSQTAHYQIDDIPVGVYKISLDPSSDPPYIGEWFDNAQTPEQAADITITAADTVKNVDFILDRGGAVSGRIFLDNLLTDYTLGGTLYIDTGSANGFVNGYYVPPNDEGLYLLSGLQPGQYKIGFVPDYTLSNEYPVVWYDQVGASSQGVSVDIMANDTTENITFILRKGGRIQGFVHQPDGMTPLGFDSMQVDLMLYDPESGNIISDVTQNTFSAGYRTPALFPGLYKFQALAQVSSMASWYYDGGNDFEDLNSTGIEVQSGVVHEVDITLPGGEGSISGVVYEEDGSTPTERPGRIYAYDGSGHIVQSTVIGIDPANGQLLDSGQYRLTGLKSGTYYLMLTFDFSDVRMIANKNGPEKSLITDQMDQVLVDRIRPGMLRMKQIWYGEVVVDLDYVRYLQFQNIPDGAVQVSVTEPGDTPDIDFYYLRSAIEITDITNVPAAFGLESIYPNPFNPSTTIRYAVPRAGQVSIEIFDILGRKVVTLFDQNQTTGWHTVQWNGLNEQQQAVTSGIYIARLKAEGQVSAKKMILLR